MKSPEDMLGAVTRSMKERTGKSLEEWVAIVGASGIDPLNQKSVRNWLRSEHGIKQNSQWAIADAAARAAGWEAPTVAEYIDQQYSGPQGGAETDLRQDCSSRARPRRRCVDGGPRRVHPVRPQASVCCGAPSRSHVDLGLRYVTPPQSSRLVLAKVPGQSTHKVRLTGAEEVDDEVLSLLAAAYDQNG